MLFAYFGSCVIRPLLCGTAVLLGACASTQLNSNALDLAGNVDQLITSQVLYNVTKFIHNRAAIPTQVNIPAGSVTTTNQASLQFSDPLTRALTAGHQVATAAAKTVTDTAQSVRNAQTLTPSVSDQWSQTWSLNPITDADQIRRLRALYRYAVGGTDGELCKEYPLVRTALPTQSGTKTQTAADSLFLKEPGCVLCDLGLNEHDRSTADKLNKCGNHPELYINPKLSPSWLRYSCFSGAISRPPPGGDTYLGSYGGCSVYSANDADYYEFILFVLEASGQGSAAGQSGKNPRAGAQTYFPGGPMPSIIP